MQPYKGRGVKTAKKKKIDVQGVIRLKVILGDLRVNVWFGLSRSVAKRVILGTPFYYRVIRECFPKDKKIVPKDSRTVHILTEDHGLSLAKTLKNETSSTNDSETSSSDEAKGGKDRPEMLLASADLDSLQVGDDPTVRVAKPQ